MNKVIFIVGLPGSGKTTYFNNNYNKFEKYILFDEYQSSNIGNSRDFNRSNSFLPLITALHEGKIPVIIDIQFCVQEHRQNAVNELRKTFKNIEIEYVYFRNDPNRCKKNVLERREGGWPAKGEILTIDEWTPKYNIPEGTIVLEVFNCSIY